MPWTAGDAHRKTHKALTPSRKRQWAAVANSVLARTGSESSAIIQANGVLKNHPSRKRGKRRKKRKIMGRRVGMTKEVLPGPDSGEDVGE